MKKFAAVTLCLMLVVSMLFAGGASAEEISSFDESKPGTLTLLKYEPDDKTTPVSGAEFKAYQVLSIKDGLFFPTANFNDVTGLVPDLVSEDGSPTYTSTNDLLKLIPALRSKANGLAASSDENGMIYTSTMTDEGKYEFGEIKLGVYLVVESVVPDGYNEITMPFLASVPEWHQQTDGDTVTGEWVYNVVAYPKDEKVTVDKTFDDDKKEGVKSIGDEIPYTVKTNIPTYSFPADEDGTEKYDVDLKSFTYKFTDTMSDGLTFNNDLKAEIVGKSKVFSQKSGDDDTDWDYTLELGADGKTITADFNWEKLNDYQGEELTFTYSATLNENAVIGGGGNENSAYVTYTNDPLIENSIANTDKSKTTVYTYGMKLIKMLGGEKPAPDSDIENVKFQLSDNGEVTSYPFVQMSSGKYVKYNAQLADSPPTESPDSDFSILIDGTSYTVTRNLSPDENGELTVDGLIEGAYCLSENATASGYSLLSDKIHFTLTADQENGIYTGTVTAVLNDGPAEIEALTDGRFKITVDNALQPFLPLSGGQGIAMIIAGGILLIIGAFILLRIYLKRKRSRATA